MSDAINVQCKRNKRLIERARPSIDEGKEIRGLFVGETLIINQGHSSTSRPRELAAAG